MNELLFALKNLSCNDVLTGGQACFFTFSGEKPLCLRATSLPLWLWKLLSQKHTSAHSEITNNHLQMYSDASHPLHMGDHWWATWVMNLYAGKLLQCELSGVNCQTPNIALPKMRDHHQICGGDFWNLMPRISTFPCAKSCIPGVVPLYCCTYCGEKRKVLKKHLKRTWITERRRGTDLGTGRERRQACCEAHLWHQAADDKHC